MTNAKELRIGNLVNNFDKYHQIRDGEDIDDADRHNCFQPIELTEDILIKCGFVFKASNYQYKEPNWVYLDEDILPFGIDQEGDMFYFNKLNNMPDVQLQYLHQLQNLYFALTGEELSIELNAQESDTTEAK